MNPSNRSARPSTPKSYQSLIKMQLHLHQLHLPRFQSFLHQLHVLVLQRTILRTDVDHFFYQPLDYELGAPQAWKFGRVQCSTHSFGYSCSEDTVIFSVNTAAAQHLCAHLLAVVANLATPIIAVDSPHRGSIVSCADDTFVFDDDRAYSLF